MEVEIYKQSYENILFRKNIDILEIEEYMLIGCEDCNGSGSFIYPDNTISECVRCRGTGKVYYNMY